MEYLEGTTVSEAPLPEDLEKLSTLCREFKACYDTISTYGVEPGNKSLAKIILVPVKTPEVDCRVVLTDFDEAELCDARSSNRADADNLVARIKAMVNGETDHGQSSSSAVSMWPLQRPDELASEDVTI